jgi:hypothetical protein
MDKKFPSFKAQCGRDPIPGKDFDPEGSLCQDDAEYFGGFGRYSDTPPASIAPAPVDKIARAQEMGRSSFAAGRKRSPITDPTLFYLLKEEGDNVISICRSWLEGWDEANLISVFPKEEPQTIKASRAYSAE